MSGYKYTRLKDRPYWKWFRALYLYEMNEVIHLSKLIEYEQIPDKIRMQISKIISGQLKPNKSSASKLKVRVVDRLNLLENLYDFEQAERIELDEFYKKKKDLDKKDMLTDQKSDEFIGYKRSEYKIPRDDYLEKESKEIIKANFRKSCHSAGENLPRVVTAYKKFKERIEKWPYI